MDVKLQVTEIQRFCMHDGPGVRTTVFLKGCPLRCAWCHNPETQSPKPELLFYANKCIGCKICESLCKQGAHTVAETHEIDRTKCDRCFACTAHCPTGALQICGKEMSVEDILTVVEKDRAFYGEEGGLTLSGGEPFFQGEAAIALLKAAKQRNLTTAVETCGYADLDSLRAAIPYIDLFLWDIKDTDDDRHKRYTGVSNKLIFKNLEEVDRMGARIRLRCILVNGVNTEIEHYEKIAEIASRLHRLDGVELLPYHAYGGAKATFLGADDNGKTAWIPDASQIEFAKNVLKSKEIFVVTR